MRETGIGTSLILIATGAILAFAIRIQSSVIDIASIGVILLVVGLVGLMLSFVVLGSWGASRHVDDTYVDDPYVTPPHEHRRVRSRDVLFEDDDPARVERVREIRR